MKITIPELALVVLIGPSGSGKSTLACKHFKPTEVLSSDFCRGLVSDDENDQSATSVAFQVLHFIAAKRLAAGKLIVVDATNVQPEARKPLVELAREYHVFPIAIVLNLPEKLCQARNHERADRDFGPHVIRQQCQQLRRSLRHLEREGFRQVYIVSSPEEVEALTIERQRLWNNLKHERGPFDIIGDVHGCLDELLALLEWLGYAIIPADNATNACECTIHPPQGRKAIFLGDLVDRGPNVPGVLRLAMSMVESETAICIPGNHDVKLVRALWGKKTQITHGLAESLAQLEHEPPDFRASVAAFLDGLISHYVLDDGRLVVAHGGMKESLQGRASGKVRDFALYGETTGETDEFGLPIRHNWAAEYRGNAMVVYGHTPVPEPEWLNGTINIDTGCVFGGRLTALRYPEKELVSVPAQRVYCQPIKPLLKPEFVPALTAQQQHDDVLDIKDVLGKRRVSTRLRHSVTIQEENAIAALEVMSRFAANPKWLIYLPPTMSPSETSQMSGLLEHPAEAFDYYRREGVAWVVCEEKHMGSRAIVIVCQNEQAARERFGVIDEGIGICYTRTGRRFFDDRVLEAELLEQVRLALDAMGFWDAFHTTWVCLDCELMPWSVKAQELLRQQYAPVGAAARAAMSPTIAALVQAIERGMDLGELCGRYRERAEMARLYIHAYQQYCWRVGSVADLKLAPFHLLATEGTAHIHRNHQWHMEVLAKICQASENASAGKPVLQPTPFQIVDVNDSASQEAGIEWWVDITSHGGEGTVVKSFNFVVQGKRGLVQPAVKCRGKEYLRIIYGPEYTAPENLDRLRSRGLSAKRSLALREFALGIEALERFVGLEPLRRVHECVFGILALESEPIDPRL